MAQEVDANQPEDKAILQNSEAQEREGAAGLIHLRNDFYRDSYHRVLKALLLALLVILLTALVLFYVVLNPPKPKYFAVDSNGRITPLVPLNKPNLTRPALLQWVTQAALAAFSFNFVNYKAELQAASEFFTPVGWRTFIQAIEQSNNLVAIKSKKLIVSAVAQGAPTIVWSGLMSDGRLAWNIQLPLLITFQSANTLSQQAVVVRMRVVRVSTTYSAKGIGIDQFVAA